MRHIRIILFILIFFPFHILAHQDKIITIKKSNVFLQYQIGWEAQEIGKINEILGHLTGLLVEKRNFKEDVLISFTHDYVQQDTTYYALAHGDFSIIDYPRGKNLDGFGIKLFIQDRQLDIQKVLSIIDNAISNIELLKKKQNLLIVDRHMITNGRRQYDTLISIPWKEIENFSTRTTSIVRDIINQRTYSNLQGAESLWNIDYYYQKNKFHFYNTSDPKTQYNPKTGNADTVKVYGEDILVVDNILEIFGDWNHGHFVFINDSIFYYIPQLKSNILGPHKIDSIRAGRPPVRRFEIDDEPMLRYTLYFDRYIDFSKALFIPDSNRLISNFDDLENEFIINLISNKRLNEIEKAEKKPSYSLFLIILIAINVIVILYFGKRFLRRKKSVI